MSFLIETQFFYFYCIQQHAHAIRKNIYTISNMNNLTEAEYIRSMGFRQYQWSLLTRGSLVLYKCEFYKIDVGCARFMLPRIIQHRHRFLKQLIYRRQRRKRLIQYTQSKEYETWVLQFIISKKPRDDARLMQWIEEIKKNKTL